MPARGRRTPKTPTLSQLKATYEAARTPAPTAPRRVSPRETTRPAYSPTVSPARPAGSIKPFTSGAVLVAPRATTPAVPTPAPTRLPTGYDPATGGIYTGGLPQQQSQYQLPRQTSPWMQTGYDPSIGGISGKLMQEYMPQYWKATEQQRAKERFLQGPGAPWTAGTAATTTADGLPTLPDWPGPGGGGGAGGGGAGGYYRAPSVSSGSRASTSRAVSRGLVNWRIGL